MPRISATNSERRGKYTTQYPSEFFETTSGLLWCRLCSKSVNYEKKSNIDSHRLSDTHIKGMSTIALTSQPQQAVEERIFKMDLVQAFLKCDIPLNKLRYDSFKEFFNKYHLPLISQSSAQSIVNELARTDLQKIIQYVGSSYFFIVTDESYIRSKFIVNILIGRVETPKKTLLLDCIVSESPINSDKIIRMIGKTILKNNFKRDRFILLLSDAASYMIKAYETLKILFVNLFHVTCVSHLLHNCCLKLKNNYKLIDRMIASVKKLTCKNKHRRTLFANIGLPPTPIVTRWGSWLSAIDYYYKNFHEIKTIVENMEGTGLILQECKDALFQNGLETEQSEVYFYFISLNGLIKRFEAKEYTIETGYTVLNDLYLPNDPVNIKEYIAKRLKKSGIMKIIQRKSEVSVIGSLINSYILKCQCTSVDVERSFSLLNNLYTDKRQFSDENLKWYIMLSYNK